MTELDLKMTGGVSGEELERVLEEKMPPIARKVVLIDFDDTIAPFGYLFGFPEPFPGISKFTRSLKDQGYTIGIFTSRLSPTWMRSADTENNVKRFERNQRNYIDDYCERFDIEYDFATAEKVPCEAYIDDKAVRFEGSWAPIAERWAIDVTE